MSSYSSTAPPASFQATLRAFACCDSLPFQDVLSEEDIQQACRDEDIDFAQGSDDVYTPAITLWAWLSQCLSPAKSCLAAVARVIVLRVALGLQPPSANTGAYCKARPKLSAAFLERLTLTVGQRLEAQVPTAWLWHGRHVHLVDAFVVTAADTASNQKQFPQHKGQKRGLGTPLIRVVVLLAFASAALTGAAVGPCEGKETGETALFRRLLHHLRRGDLVVADRYYCTYWMVAALHQLGVDACFRLHQKRTADFTKGKRLGPQDHLVKWPKPARPAWMDEATYAGLPDEMTVREVGVQVVHPGYRTKHFVVVTTLADEVAYKSKDVGDLYHKRWHVELDIRNIKQTMCMYNLSCKTSEMLQKEIWVHLLAYNLIRKVMAQAALRAGLQPRQLSFAGAMQTWQAFQGPLLLLEGAALGVMYRALLDAVKTHRVGKRPGRVEPREVKRRSKQMKLMTRSRAQRRAELLAGCAA